MNLFDVKLNACCIIKEINIKDEKNKIRLMELGLVKGCKVVVKKKSVFKKNLLITFNYSCFTINDKFAKEIVVNYA